MKNRTFFALLAGIILGALAVILSGIPSGKNKKAAVSADDWRKINLVLNALDENYVDSIDRGKVSDAAITAALSALDPHSIYMEPTRLEASETELEGNFDGIGIQFNVPNDTAIVLEVIPGGPSELVGMMVGDRLLRVDGIDIAGVKYPQDSMVRHMRGPAGTKVAVTVLRDGEEIPFEIIRGKIPVHSIAASFMADDTTGYIRLSTFAKTTYEEVTMASLSLLEKGMTRLIFDVRGNSGGYFDQALQLSNMFLERDSLIVYLQGLHRKREEYYATGRGILKNVRLTVLVDDGTASSSEIFAGAMQDNSRGVIVGRRTFGKGLVQEPIYFSDGSGVRLTIARFYTPSGRCIQKAYGDDYVNEVYSRYDTGELVEADSMKIENGGIIPDVFVPLDTTKATRFYIECSRKATTMRFASAYFDTHKAELKSIDDYGKLLKYLDNAGLESKFLAFASERDGLVPAPGEWVKNKDYMMEVIRALVGRYSKLGDNAYYHLVLQTDQAFHCAMKQ